MIVIFDHSITHAFRYRQSVALHRTNRSLRSKIAICRFFCMLFVTGLSPDDVLEELGSHFLSYCLARGYDKMLRVLGSNLSDFLSNLDNLHDHVTVSYCNMKAPSFRVTPGPNGSIHLHYYSTRKGLQGIVRGLVKTVARDLFETDVSIGICRVLEQAGERYHFLMEISDNSLLKVSDRTHCYMSTTSLVLTFSESNGVLRDYCRVHKVRIM